MSAPKVFHRDHEIVFDVETEEWKCGSLALAYAMKATLEHGGQAMRAAALHLIGSGTGCDARVNGEKPDLAFYEKLREHDRRNASKTARALKMWGMR